MRKTLQRLAVVLATVAGLTIAVTGVADANVPAIFVGASPNHAGDCIGVILDQDGHYNHMDSNGNGYDARLCAPGDTRSAFGWSHAGGYYIGGPNLCVEEDAFVNGAWQLLREICTTTRPTTFTRFIDSTNFYRLINRGST